MFYRGKYGWTVFQGGRGVLALVIIVGLPIYLATKLFRTTGWVIPVLAVIALLVWSAHVKKQQRLAYLREKYPDEDIVQKVFAGEFWRGQTEEQLRDSLAAPVAIDNKLLKTMTRAAF